MVLYSSMALGPSETVDLVNIAVDTGRVLSSVNTALQAMKNGLHSVKVSKYDALAVQRKLEGELFDKWEEKTEVMKATTIPIEQIDGYLDHMKDAYEGIDDEMRKKMNAIKWSGNWDYKIFEFKYNNQADSGARYGMIAFGKSPDNKFVDCMFAMHKLDFKIAPERIVREESHSTFWGIKKWTTTWIEVRERALGKESLKVIKNYFRQKALEAFSNEGLIDRINYVSSIDEIPDDPKDKKRDEL